MAYTNSKQVVTHGAVERFAALYDTVRLALERRATYKRTLRELQALSNRELADLGIHPGMISRIASEAAYGKKA